jgi:intein/homing endonuclease
MRKNVNACCSGDTMVMTAYGAKSFRDLAKEGKDVPVYCLDKNGEYEISMMIHPRITGYNVDVYRVKLENGLEFDVTPEHRMLTDAGYLEAYDIIAGDDSMLIFELKAHDELMYDAVVEDYEEAYTNLTKKGTLLKSCEYCGEMFESIWDEREVCACGEHHSHLFYKMDADHREMNMKCKKYTRGISKVVSVDYIGRMDVYNGTVEQYHNYFTVDERTNLMVNQLNCGESYIRK